MTSIPAKTFFLFLVFIQFRRRKYIISSKLFVKLVKAAKAYPHAKFYNLSTAYHYGDFCNIFLPNIGEDPKKVSPSERGVLAGSVPYYSKSGPS